MSHSQKKRWTHHLIEQEEQLLPSEHKLGRQLRKVAQAKDRSKYKKTDQKRAEPPPKGPLKRGRVITIVPEGIMVNFENKMYRCTLKGVLKKEKTLAKNLVAVGDFVLFEIAPDHEGVIAYVEPRRSVLERADNLSRKKRHLIAANVDRVFITASVVHPPLKPPLIDRYIIAAKKGNMMPIILINKVDLLDIDNDPLIDEERTLFKQCLESYRKAGIPLYPISAHTGKGIGDLKHLMQDNVSVFSGQSGVGKSSLINAATGLELQTGEITEKTRKGAHTTTYSQLLPLSFGGFCVDTPGIRSFGLWNLQRDEIDAYFTEIFEVGKECHFPNCSHTHESDCAVQRAVEEGALSSLRYASYTTLLEKTEQKHFRR
ncbi:MAG: ribosome small subunit-dependent GTPase A [Chlamydiia bacterium]|nr:ribosome small subunit-dependent GTPase A [Chlamydiia bacterium]